MVPLEARRLTGPHLLGDHPGAGLDVPLASEADAAALAAWERLMPELLAGLGWASESIAVRRFAGSAALAISAPPDLLYAATDVLEAGWEAAVRTAGGDSASIDVAHLRERIARERNPALRALAEAAAEHGVTFLADDDGVSLGSGAGSVVYRPDGLPAPSAVAWDGIRDVPVVLVTGSNGKTTTVRLLAAMAAESGRRAGHTSTDGVVIGAETVATTDYAGPMGARMVLRDRRVDLAILETARGGILRRGLATRRADVAVVTNIAEDHFGDFGITTLHELADVKLMVARVVPPTGTVVLNADDPILAARGPALGRHVAWFSLDPSHPLLDRRVLACTVERDTVVIHAGGTAHAVARLADIPITRSGAVRYNVANALGATLAAAVLGFAPDRVGAALRRFTGSASENPGRGNVMDIGGVQVIVDYAHNPHGIAALAQLADTIPAARRLVLLGQAGDRDDDAIRELARAAWKLRPDRIVLKELAGLRRGRGPGEVRALLADELRRLGAPAGSVDTVESDVEAVEAALRWARPGDLLILPVHEQRDEVLQLLADARTVRA